MRETAEGDVNIPSAGLDVVRFTLCLTFTRGGRVSQNWGTTLRGGFGWALRRTACVWRREDCDGCLLTRMCSYGYLFETPIRAEDRVMRKYTQAPHPFVFEPPQRFPAVVRPGDTVELNVVLIGKALAYLPYVLHAIEELGRHGLGRDEAQFVLRQVRSEHGTTVRIQSLADLWKDLPATRLTLSPGPSRISTFQLYLDTPARIVSDGATNSSLDVFSLVAALRRRLFLLRYFHQDGAEEQLSTGFLDAAKGVRVLNSSSAWRNSRRFSTRQQQEVPLSGVTGLLACEGDFGILEPILRAGEYVHVGKNATFGLGKLRVVEGEVS